MKTVKSLVLLVFTLTTLIISLPASAGGKDYNPVCWLDFFAQNNTAVAITINVQCDKGDFWVQLDPGQSFGYGIDYEVPLGGFQPDWFNYGGNITVTVNGTTVSKHAKCLANLEFIGVMVEPAKIKKGKKQPKKPFEVLVELIE